jgi:hypothetical protein
MLLKVKGKIAYRQHVTPDSYLLCELPPGLSACPFYVHGNEKGKDMNYWKLLEENSNFEWKSF